MSEEEEKADFQKYKAKMQKHLDKACEVVASWPEWKQNVLASMFSGELKIPREQVVNE